jgi:adiponectin receptor
LLRHNNGSMAGGTVRRRTGTSSDRIHQAAVSASANVPHRTKRHAKQQLTHALESFENLPEYLRDNEFIHGFYRKEQSLVSSLRTLFKLHNETGNVWTHFIGAPWPKG